MALLKPVIIRADDFPQQQKTDEIYKLKEKCNFVFVSKI